MKQELPSRFSLAFLLALGAANVGAETVGPEQATTEDQEALAADPEADQTAAVAEALLNPLSSLWIMFAQNDTVWMDGDTLDDLGEGGVVQNTTLLQPVMPFQLTENWKMIFRLASK